MSSESAPSQGDASTGRKCEGKNPPHQCFACEKEYTRPHKRLEHMRDCCPDQLQECPTCGVGYTNDYGVKLHHSRKHGESIAKTEIYCKECGEFYKEVYDCNAASYSVCDECRPKVKAKRMAGENNPQYGTGEYLEFDCQNCGKHHRRPLRVNTPNVYCDKDCRDAHQVGEHNPVYNGGTKHYYGPEWEKQREKALERDNHRCQSCGKHNDDATIALNVHHIRPYRLFDDMAKAHKVSNLVCLCISCHNKWEGIPLKPQLL